MGAVKQKIHRLPLTAKAVVWMVGGSVGVLAAIVALFITSIVRITPAVHSAAAVLAAHKPALILHSIWPTVGAEMQGRQEFRAEVIGALPSEYKVYWSINDGPLNPMIDDPQTIFQKVTAVDVSIWNTQFPQELAFIATDIKGEELARVSMEVKITPKVDVAAVAAAAAASAQAKAQASTKISLPPASGTSAVLGASLYADPNSEAAKQAAAWRSSRPADAALMDKIAAQSQGKWLGGWTANVQSTTASYTSAAAAVGKVPVFVLYNVPQRNCNGSGGAANYDQYVAWVQQIANGIGNRRVITVLEPDALPCISHTGIDQDQRYRSMSKAVDILKANPATAVYIDAGHAGWVGVDEIANRLAKANIAHADGFSLNVSNFVATDVTVNYGNQVSAKLNGRHFVIDTSRNGLGPSPGGEWCNPPGRAAGSKPTTSTPYPKVDAFLWVKILGESDGNWSGCGGGPPAGAWWPDYALGLIQRANW